MQRWLLLIIAPWMVAASAMIPTAHAASPPTYVALGDSVAAGAGLPNSDGTVCDRSTQAYPYRVAAGLNTSVTQLACSGAKVNDGIYGDQERGGVKISPQLDAAFASGTPGIITMTVGANDVRWTQFLTKCQVATCGTAFDDATAKVLRADLRVELYWALHKIEQKSNGKPPTVLLNGYYAPIADTVCPGTERITAAERSWIRARTADLNQAIYSVTPWFSFAHYVPVSFAGHEVCSSAPWIQGLSDPAPFHPYATGQDAIARANLRALGR